MIRVTKKSPAGCQRMLPTLYCSNVMGTETETIGEETPETREIAQGNGHIPPKGGSTSGHLLVSRAKYNVILLC